MTTYITNIKTFRRQTHLCPIIRWLVEYPPSVFHRLNICGRDIINLNYYACFIEVKVGVS